LRFETLKVQTLRSGSLLRARGRSFGRTERSLDVRDYDGDTLGHAALRL